MGILSFVKQDHEIYAIVWQQGDNTIIITDLGFYQSADGWLLIVFRRVIAMVGLLNSNKGVGEAVAKFKMSISYKGPII